MPKIGWTKKSSNELLLKSIENMIFLALAIGLLCGMGIVLAGIAIKADDTKGYIAGGLTISVLLFFLILVRTTRKKLIPELKRRLKA
jgi:hypothetical protein